ncbi:PP2C family protein-serine/threonine phosphatase [Streptomyces sp. DH12]|uniref:PP2C family protein-serine/threonine phosphatase n=1 Tax=Streptomyces sp. DH12 TaxID=2857010 RepID=UPI001E5525FB|nr:SpoIIE family protein phosphatase [Streptomyces sp. DH12]
MSGPHRRERPYPGGRAGTDRAAFAALMDLSAEELYETAPCGYLSTLMDGTVARINATLLGWLGLDREEVVGRMRFTDLLSVGGRLYHETHYAPLLHMRGEVSGIALEMRQADGGRLPVLASSAVKYGSEGEPLLVRTTVFDARDRRAYEKELLRGRREAEEAARRAEADRARLQEALAALQRSLLPTSLPDVPGLAAAAYYHTASPDRLGGDFYDLFPLDRERWGFFLGDVCGKGPEAAAVTSLTRYTLRAAALHDTDPVAVLATLNTVLHERYAGGDPRYCTAVFGTLEHESGGDGGGRVTVRLASGGHPPAVVVRADGRSELVSTPGGLLVGILREPRFTGASTVLEPGDTLLLYTDGLTEARTGPDRARFGDEALRDFVVGHAGAPPDVLVKALTGLLEGFGEGLDDDTALLALGVPAGGHPTHDPATDTLR